MTPKVSYFFFAHEYQIYAEIKGDLKVVTDEK
jgi:hypothetical protein